MKEGGQTDIWFQFGDLDLYGRLYPDDSETSRSFTCWLAISILKNNSSLTSPYILYYTGVLCFCLYYTGCIRIIILWLHSWYWQTKVNVTLLIRLVLLKNVTCKSTQMRKTCYISKSDPLRVCEWASIWSQDRNEHNFKIQALQWSSFPFFHSSSFFKTTTNIFINLNV